MLKELFEALKEHAGALVAPIEIATNDPRCKTFMVNGAPKTVAVSPGAVRHVAFALADFLAAVESRGQADVVVFHSTTEVVALLDGTDRHDRITLPLKHSELFTIAGRLGTPMAQNDFVRLLKNELSLAAPASLRAAVSKIEVLAMNGQRSEIAPGREKGSREFAVEGGREIPEGFTLTVPVYANHGLRVNRQIKMSLDFDLQRSPVTFVAKALPDELETAVQDAQRELHQLIEDALPNALVVNGTP